MKKLIILLILMLSFINVAKSELTAYYVQSANKIFVHNNTLKTKSFMVSWSDKHAYLMYTIIKNKHNKRNSEKYFTVGKNSTLTIDLSKEWIEFAEQYDELKISVIKGCDPITDIFKIYLFDDTNVTGTVIVSRCED